MNANYFRVFLQASKSRFRLPSFSHDYDNQTSICILHQTTNNDVIVKPGIAIWAKYNYYINGEY